MHRRVVRYGGNGSVSRHACSAFAIRSRRRRERRDFAEHDVAAAARGPCDDQPAKGRSGLMNERSRVVLTALAVRGHRSATRERIENYQNRKLRQVIEHAYRCVPYYTQLFDRHGLRPSDIRIPADLHRIPITRKRDIRALPPEQLLARGVDSTHLFERTTSGVTGEPFVIRRTPREELLLSAVFLRRELRALGVRRRSEARRVGEEG